jgi:hypothetical protein
VCSGSRKSLQKVHGLRRVTRKFTVALLGWSFLRAMRNAPHATLNVALSGKAPRARTQ